MKQTDEKPRWREVEPALKSPIRIALEHPRGIVRAGKQVNRQSIVTHKINGSECMAYVRLGWLEITTDAEGRRCYQLTAEGRKVAEKEASR